MSLKVAVLVSGGGTTLQNLIDRINAGQLTASIELVISNKAGVKALQRASDHHIPAEVIKPIPGDVAGFSESIFARCRESGIDLVVLGGFLQLLEIPEDYMGRVINTHPSLIPSFCGKGYYGLHVHRAALERGAKVSGCTIHFCDNVYDHGPIIEQRCVRVHEDDTPESLAARVFQAECEALPQAIQWFAEGKLEIDRRRVLVKE